MSENYTFQSKDVLQLQIAEETNLRGITTRAVQSDSTNLAVIDTNFYVNAKFSDKFGWTVHSAICREDNDILKNLPKDMHQPNMVVSDRKIALRTPMRSKYIVPFIKYMVAKNPGLSS